VSVHGVMKALNELCLRALYKAYNICINDNCNSVLAEEDSNSADTFENPIFPTLFYEDARATNITE
jgi:hypothetical protein